MISDRRASGNHIIPHDGDAAGLVAVLSEELLQAVENSITGFRSLNGVDFDVERIMRRTIQEEEMWFPKGTCSEVCFFRWFSGQTSCEKQWEGDDKGRRQTDDETPEMHE